MSPELFFQIFFLSHQAQKSHIVSQTFLICCFSKGIDSILPSQFLTFNYFFRFPLTNSIYYSFKVSCNSQSVSSYYYSVNYAGMVGQSLTNPLTDWLPSFIFQDVWISLKIITPDIQFYREINMWRLGQQLGTDIHNRPLYHELMKQLAPCWN